MDHGIPTTSEIVAEARRRMGEECPGSLLPEAVGGNFSDAVEVLFGYAYAVFKEYEKRAVDGAIYAVLDRTDQETFTREEVVSMLEEIKDVLIRTEMNMKQSRASRAGKTFEVIVQSFLGDLGIPSENVTRENKKAGLRRIDLVVPDTETAIKSPDKAHFLALKTSLRERWAQVVEQQRPGQRTYLLTLLQKETISNETATKITDSGIFLYVPDRVKDDRFMDNVRIRRMSDLPFNMDV